MESDGVATGRVGVPDGEVGDDLSTHGAPAVTGPCPSPAQRVPDDLGDPEHQTHRHQRGHEDVEPVEPHLAHGRATSPAHRSPPSSSWSAACTTTIPLSPSTVSSAPWRRRTLVPTSSTAGTPSSRARIAACESGPPRSNTIAPARVNSGDHH